MLEATLHRRVEMKRSVIAAFALLAATSPLGAQTPRPLTFLDAQNMRQASGAELSPDGRSMLYTLSVPDWNAARRQSDIYMVSLDRGLPSTRQLTFTKDKNETSPKWSNDGSFIAFVSDRDATGAAPAGGAGGGRGGGRGGEGGGRNQLFVMRLDGGEAKRVSDARDGISTFTFSKDGKALVYASGRSDNEQIYALTIADLWQGDIPHATQWTRHATGVDNWQWSADGSKIYFIAPDSIDRDERARMDKQFTVRPRNPASSLSSLWVFDVASKEEKKLAGDGTSYSVANVSISPDGKWIGYSGLSSNRYERGILEQSDFADLYLLEIATGKVERLTKNDIISESGISFSPDSRFVAFSAPNDFKFQHLSKVYIRPVDQPNAPWKKLGGKIDLDVRVGGRGGGGGDAGVETGFWSAKGDTIYFNTGIKATTQLFSLAVATDEVKQLTSLKAVTSVGQIGRAS